MTVSVVLPTIKGRESLLEQTVAAFRDQPTPVQLIVVRDRPCIGQAWNDGAACAEGDYLMLAADDVLPADGALQAAIDAADTGFWPSPRILNPDETLHSCGTLGQGALLGEAAEGTPCHSSPFPFMVLEAWDEIGPSLAIGYYADDYLGHRAVAVGLSVVVARGYELTHIGGLGTPAAVARAMADRSDFIRAVAEGSWETVPA